MCNRLYCFPYYNQSNKGEQQRTPFMSTGNTEAHHAKVGLRNNFCAVLKDVMPKGNALTCALFQKPLPFPVDISLALCNKVHPLPAFFEKVRVTSLRPEEIFQRNRVFGVI